MPRIRNAADLARATRALGLADRVGSLTPGKRADIVLVRTTDLNMAPFTDPAHMIVQSANPSNVDTVVIDGRIRVDPVALGVDCEREHLRHIGTLEEHLLPRDQSRQEFQFHLVELKQVSVLVGVERWIREEQLRGAALHHRAQQVGRREVVDGLGRQNHRGVALPPR